MMRRRLVHVALLALTLLLGAPAAPAREAVPAPEVSAVTPNGYRLRVPIGDARIVRAEAAGLLFDEISIPGGTDASAPGEAQLPIRVVHARIPWGVEPRARLVPGASRALGSLRPPPFARIASEPSARGRRSAAEILDAVRSPRYAAARGEALRRAIPMAARGARILAIEIAPIQWDPASGAATQLEEVTIELSWDRPSEPLPGEPESRGRPGGAASLEPESVAGPRYAAAAAASVAPRLSGSAAPAPSVPAEHAGPGPLRLGPSRPWVRLGTLRSNLYRVTAADLGAAGVATGAIDPASFRLFRARPGDLPESVDVDLGPDSLRECAVDVTGAGDGSFDPGDALYFYGTGSSGFGDDLMLGGTTEYVESQRAADSPYWLTWGPGPFAAPPLRTGARDAAPA
ncbi:MAG TPA: hypothetical protein VLT84_05570, partial [Acidobacteriota bacterium]|nr:hypothetical protein [Acidobacteriota bacterium]